MAGVLWSNLHTLYCTIVHVYGLQSMQRSFHAQTRALWWGWIWMDGQLGVRMRVWEWAEAPTASTINCKRLSGWSMCVSVQLNKRKEKERENTVCNMQLTVLSTLRIIRWVRIMREEILCLIPQLFMHTNTVGFMRHIHNDQLPYFQWNFNLFRVCRHLGTGKRSLWRWSWMVTMLH